MVEVRVREQDGIELPWIEVEWLAVERLQRARSLEKAAVDQQPPPASR